MKRSIPNVVQPYNDGIFTGVTFTPQSNFERFRQQQRDKKLARQQPTREETGLFADDANSFPPIPDEPETYPMFD